MVQSKPRLIEVEYDRLNRHLHLWLGPAGVHLAWPDLHKSRLDWCRQWRQPPEPLPRD